MNSKALPTPAADAGSPQAECCGTPEGFDPEQGFGFNLHDAARLLRHDFERRARQHGVTRAQWSALVYLTRTPGIRQSQLAEILEVTPIAVARLVDRMEIEGLLERRPDPDDRRAWRLYLTPRAMERLDVVREMAKDTREIALAGISPEDQEVVIAALKRIRENLAASRGAHSSSTPPADDARMVSPARKISP